MGKDLCLFLNACVHAQPPNRIWLFVTPWTVARQVPLSMGFSRQEYWSGLPFPSPGDLPNPGMEPWSSALAARFFTIWAIREARLTATVRPPDSISLPPESYGRCPCRPRSKRTSIHRDLLFLPHSLVSSWKGYFSSSPDFNPDPIEQEPSTNSSKKASLVPKLGWQ